ncbi:CRAL/TRIO domain-containing protein [Wolfiporia cocos MD-104 SS10]|uniref:CRAL/TRIO domain-containing protein n=1 Tax=Wolfiporia cocos (strain MD-104) TaxID=742152 RepID=A0A2H3J713_WOLCO|nr:CRAL/TRIO domain-containing protein [Wolfiporia cocos MD-104 SS10]
MWFHKTDKAGRPLSIQHYSGVNMPELYKLITPERFMQYIIVTTESIPREIFPTASRAAGRQVEGESLVADLKGFRPACNSLGQFWQMKNIVRESSQIMQDYFPELYVHNSLQPVAADNPRCGYSIFDSFVKLWLAKETLAKTDILRADYQAVLLKDIDRENLPVVLGGTCECEDVEACKRCQAPR